MPDLNAEGEKEPDVQTGRIDKTARDGRKRTRSGSCGDIETGPEARRV